MNSRILASLKLAAYVLVLLIGARFMLKQYGLHKERAALVHELKGLTSEASFYRQFDQAGAERVLLQCLAVIGEARELDLPLEDLYERVFEKDDEEGRHSVTSEERLVRNTLDNAYRAANELGMLESLHLKELKQGRMPYLSGGKAGSGKPVIVPLIDPDISPGMDKVVPNLEILPPGSHGKRRELSSIEIAAARQLAKLLESAKIIERSVYELILSHYETKVPEEKR